ncbi:hypothetical protein [Cereibacter johrii]|uniref:hypothetical protein n=1 Tax=Cereibacter johrii TaxID=445629 RepID=UPI003CF91A7E
MSATVASSHEVRVTLVSKPPRPGLAAGVISDHLGLDRPQATRLLAREGGVLAEAVARPVAERLVPLLLALGVTVRLDPSGSAEAALPVDVAVQPLRMPSEGTVGRLAAHLSYDESALRTALSRPQGLVLRMGRREAETLRRSFRRDGSVRIALSNVAGARFDLFLKPGCEMSAGLATLLRRLGLKPCLFSGAVGAGLSPRTAALVVRQHGGLVDAVNRDFQRFDLFLAGGRELARPDLADFLATRARIERTRLLSPAEARSIRLEAGLSRAAARRFHEDYAAIGLDTRIELVALAPLAEG